MVLGTKKFEWQGEKLLFFGVLGLSTNSLAALDNMLIGV